MKFLQQQQSLKAGIKRLNNLVWKKVKEIIAKKKTKESSTTSSAASNPVFIKIYALLLPFCTIFMLSHIH
jgi:hypothetical protein